MGGRLKWGKTKRGYGGADIKRGWDWKTTAPSEQTQPAALSINQVKKEAQKIKLTTHVNKKLWKKRRKQERPGS